MAKKKECEETYTDKEIKKLQESIKKTNDLMNAVEKLGGKIPKLKKAMKVLEGAINSGIDVGKAADEANQELKKLTSDLQAACGDDFACMAAVARQIQGDAIKWTLNLKNDSSVFTKSVNKTLARYLPAKLCKQLDGCAKELKKQEKACK